MALSDKQILGARALLVVAITLVTYLATIPADHPMVGEFNDKVKHVAAFYTLGLLLDFSFPESPYHFPKIAALLSYGLLIEIVQYSLPHRCFSWLDFSADLVGVFSYGFTVPVLRHIPLLRTRWRMSG